ncbi:MAG: MoaD family protein [Clostridia bacterium]|nr:MoaD family protein [Clostridia bacterium]MDH7573257.1 MoaD family protein [Clostridia bacterium]
MGVRIRVHPFYVEKVGGQEVVEVEGKNVGECLNVLLKRYPAIREDLFDKNGQLRNHVEVYVNGQPTYPEELKYPVSDGDELDIVVIATSG